LAISIEGIRPVFDPVFSRASRILATTDIVFSRPTNGAMRVTEAA
jgi:hypothetical protein